MPGSKPRVGKQSVDSRQKKENVAEKVKEIKLRQQNWMKQRKQQLSAESGDSNLNVDIERRQTAGNVRTDNAANIPLPRSRTTDSKGQRSGENPPDRSSKKQAPSKTSETINTRGKFQNWLKIRHDEDQACHGSHPQSELSSDPTPPHLVHGGGGLCDRLGTAEELRAGLMAPEDFDSLADKIVSRAQRELHGKSQDRDRDLELSSDQLTPSGAQVTMDTGNEDLSNNSCHHCTCCSQIMIGCQYTPMLLIPCGHTVCRECCEGRELCPECYFRIASATCNIMLQQIIQEYQGRRGLRQTTPPRTYRVGEEYRPHNYQQHRRDTSSRPHHHRYREDLQNLQTRLEVLASEKSSVHHECGRLSDAIAQEERQLKNVATQEETVCSQIASLQEKLSILRQHRSEYQSRCSKLLTERGESQQRLSLLEETMATLHNEVEKVKLLSET